ncbi:MULTISPECIES: uroporphyrinogen-III C-methyltransferase [Proteus]|uniref:uroporphyrinogen-III C-methyltransferase n=1 Tax=Proteus TaxID=583 RepID=UPI0010743923|nr:MULTISPECIES: uroporphyrinogen-III C-methyltransferase [Proteus]MBS3846517.1 uroporphyrinogen-III C-methyltransferase [Proteus mirabilis]MCW4520001.1 uroporphyrinogen-III C-methyltransferase [Proteus mirabilis]MDF7361358.1 uroporphyrinogen-III C-methyltransferase [Proteus mirabilis]MDM3587376.1 uroporphyrinogen-III C-methyltransferase [Proteus mirabilis]MDM3832419.1 uroporphyrinogen-III C-methyltransferase [Proteus mirabilis]
MTEQKNTNENDLQNGTSKADDDIRYQEVKPVNNKRSGLIGSAVAILVILAIGGGLYYYTTQQATKLSTENQSLKSQLAQLQQLQDTYQQRFDNIDSQFNSQKLTIDKLQNERQVTERQIQNLQTQFAAISSADVKSWLLAQADFMVKMAGRKLWNDQDVVTAVSLLKGADSSLAEMNDPSLLAIRRAINEDIGNLAALSKIDNDGTILQLNQLANQVDNLRLSGFERDGSPMDKNDEAISGSLSDWKQNLSKSWKSFMDDFITIRRRDSTAIPLLAPNQDIYLRENIRSRLLIASQAVPRHQTEIYQQSLEAVSTWVRAYFDTTDPNTTAFLDSINELEKQPITLAMPTELKSLSLLEKRVEKQIRNLLTQNETSQPEAVEAKDAEATQAPYVVDAAQDSATSGTTTSTTVAPQGE